MNSDSARGRALLAWFQAAARDLPWRTRPAGQRDPYHVLVSELMLQQTQVSRVVERYHAFITRFPDFLALARADVSDVLALWAGLGYYRRARLLHAAAIAIVSHHAGRMPRDINAIRELPGVGRYTAGAIASMAFALPEPLVDGNVTRVILRLEGRELASDEPAAQALAWRRAAELVAASDHPGAFNEALMELGATVCTPANPRCSACPWSHTCAAFGNQSQSNIPRPKKRAARQALRLECVVLLDALGRVLLEPRPATGLWAGLWHMPSTESHGRARPDPADLLNSLALPSTPLAPAGSVKRTLTHRDVSLRVWAGRLSVRGPKLPGRAWFEPHALPAMSSAHAKVLERAHHALGALHKQS
ncbi:MAG: A/G-specific adenine glycosylase [Tepidisphaera sp.]|nr:A/G-specific adenine glycosylase [Tepidisphaera sp.]